ncbi:hypothetical protein RBB50_008498 [Rhinocladiella similis]
MCQFHVEVYSCGCEGRQYIYSCALPSTYCNARPQKAQLDSACPKHLRLKTQRDARRDSHPALRHHSSSDSSSYTTSANIRDVRDLYDMPGEYYGRRDSQPKCYGTLRNVHDNPHIPEFANDAGVRKSHQSRHADVRRQRELKEKCEGLLRSGRFNADSIRYHASFKELCERDQWSVIYDYENGYLARNPGRHSSRSGSSRSRCIVM